VTITLTATDDLGGSGVAYTHYRLDGGTETSGTTISVSTLGSHAIEFWSADVAGNVENPHKSATFVIDTAAPTGTMSVNSGAAVVVAT
jgi:hypothetical protein